MRLALITFMASLLAAPAFAGDPGAEKLFGPDTGEGNAYACFSRTFRADWLAAHPGQNVAELTAFVSRRTSDGTVWHDGNLAIRFRDSAATYQVTAGCGGEDGIYSCGVDCEGGGYQMTAISKDQLSVTFDGYLRYGEISDRPSGEKTSGFMSGDKNLVVRRTDLRDCLSLIADDEIKAKIVSGAVTQ